MAAARAHAHRGADARRRTPTSTGCGDRLTRGHRGTSSRRTACRGTWSRVGAKGCVVLPARAGPRLPRLPRRRRAARAGALARPAQRRRVPAAVGQGRAVAAVGAAHRRRRRPVRRQLRRLAGGRSVEGRRCPDRRRCDPAAGLAKTFADVPAVAASTSTSPAGEFFSLLGASGCGKTTTLRMIAGFEQPDPGQILLDGRDMAADAAAPAPGQHGLPALRAVPVPRRSGTTSRSG